VDLDFAELFFVTGGQSDVMGDQSDDNGYLLGKLSLFMSVRL
jgi:hypothetical protein